MTDEHLDRQVRDADPYRPDLVARLEGAEQHLLEEIMSTPKLASVPLRRTLVRRLSAAVAAAAVIAVAVTASTLVRREPPEPYAGPVGLPGGSAGAISGWELDLKAAENLPRLLIDQPGWKATYVNGFDTENGSIRFEKDGRGLEMTWYPDQYYQSYYDDRLDVSAPEATTVAGRPADIFTYSASDFAVMLKAEGPTFVEMRTDAKWTRAAFDEILTHIVKVDAEAFLKALPPEIITPGDVRGEATKILADVPLPPNFDYASLDNGGANDPYQFAAAVTGRVTCDWIAEWKRADKAGDKAAVKEAAAALRTSHNWKVLKGMEEAGDYPEVLWEVADKVADGDVPDWYKDGLGC
ncbi:hypothetical protein FB565_000422 [Actinoplanes lutulentus]|uniref:Uncharacterized protein n=1 Tax=Actinoplanes lutulentus TaxID=1287878 RepID=A0A327ZK33_9ACTN|nr:hypothetical protein [Actinoplanes lutulentus]MBB2940718.1 hypothetical protein [Actinoplanes lutulentus]RAK43029.1 hypothetical protein B0I29_101159 [Actinoplanes lutulentus]